MALSLAGCATVNSENSFQSLAPNTAAVTQEAAQTDAPQQQTVNSDVPAGNTDAPAQETAAPGYNG
ncbi:MAG TPA: hypothetical protein PLR69_00365, partial [Candidatus Limiplasma sp.]|nr:hypothetical protein [Candidatus Limiplasma sp.]